MHILVADDDHPIRSILQMVLEEEGHIIHTASDGMMAIQIYETNKNSIDLILLDISMPGLDGFETIHLLRELERNIPIIVLSGSIDRETEERLRSLGIAHLRKPVQTQDLLNAIERERK